MKTVLMGSHSTTLDGGVRNDPDLVEARRLGDEGRVLQRSGDSEAAMERFERALDLLAGKGHHPETADVLCWAATLRRELGQTDEAEKLFTRSLEIAAWARYVPGQAYAINGLAVVSQHRGDMRTAEALYRRAGRLAADSDEFRLSGMVEQNLGVFSNIRGDLDSALIHYRKSLRAFEQAKDRQGICWVLNNLGMLQTDLGRLGEAESTLERGLANARERGDLTMEGLLELNRTEALTRGRKWKAAREACRRALAIAVERGDDLRRGEALKLQGVIARETGGLRKAIGLLEQALALASSSEDALLVAEILTEVGEAWRQKGDAARARAHWETALERFRDLDAVLDAARLEERLQELAPGH